MSYPKLLLPHLYTMESNMWVQMWVGKSVWCKKYQDFGGNIFLLLISWIYTFFSSNRWADKQDLCKGYGGPNFGEKEFQLFQPFIDINYRNRIILQRKKQNFDEMLTHEHVPLLHCFPLCSRICSFIYSCKEAPHLPKHLSYPLTKQYQQPKLHPRTHEHISQ